MSLEKWTEQPELFILAEDDILLAIDVTNDTSKQFTASILRPLTQTPWQLEINANTNNLINLQNLIFTPSVNAIDDNKYGIRVESSTTQMILQVGDSIDGEFSLKFGGTNNVYNFTLTTLTAPNVAINNTLAILSTTNDPAQNGEFTNNAGDVIIQSGGSDKNLSDMALLSATQTFTGLNTFTEDVNIIKDTNPASIILTTFSNTDDNGAFIDGRRARGTEATPLPLDDDINTLVSLAAFGYDGTSFEIGGLFEFAGTTTWTPTSHPTRFDIVTTDVDSTTPVSQLIIGPDGTADFQNNNLINIATLGIGTALPTEKLHQVGGNQLLEPTDPTLAGSFLDVTIMDDSRFAYVQGNYAYVVSDNSNTLVIIDVTNKTAPVKVGELQDNTELEGANKVWVVGDLAYVAVNKKDRLTIINVKDKTDPTFVSSVTDPILDQCNGVQVVGNYAFVCSSLGLSFAIINIKDKFNPFIEGSIVDATNFDRPTGLYVQGNYAYLTSQSNNSLSIIDITNKTNPVRNVTLSDIANISNTFGVFVAGRYAYVTGASIDTLAIYDIKDPNVITFVGKVSDSRLNEITNVHVSGNYAYTTNAAADSMAVIDITDKTTPVIVGDLVDNTTMDTAHGIFVAGKYAYVVSRSSHGLAIIDISGIDAPSASIGSINAGNISVLGNAIINNDTYANSFSSGSGGIAWDGIPVSRLGLTVFEIFTPEDLPAPDPLGEISELTNLHGVTAGYTNGESITLEDGSGTGATATASIIGNVLLSVTLTGGGSGFIVGDELTIRGNSSGLTSAKIDVGVVIGAITFPTGAYKFKQAMSFDDRWIFDDNVTITSDDGTNTDITFTGNLNTFITATNSSGDATFRDLNFILTGTNSTFIETSAALFASRDTSISWTNTGGVIGSATNGGIFLFGNGVVSGFSEGFTFDSNIANSVCAFENATFISRFNSTPTFFTVVNVDARALFADLNLIAPGFGTSTLFDIEDTVVTNFLIRDVTNATPSSADYYATGASKLDQKSIFVNVRNSPDSPDSKNIGSIVVRDNALITSVTQFPTFTDLTMTNATIFEGSNIEQWTLTDAGAGTNAEMTYIGLTQFNGVLNATITLFPSATNKIYVFRMVVDGVETDDMINTTTQLPNNITVTLPFLAPLSINTGQTVKLQVTEIGGTSSFVINDMVIIAQNP